MRGDVSQHPHPMVQHGHAKETLARIARWTLYISGAAAVAVGVIVWPFEVHELGGLHAAFGWLAIASLLALAAIAWRSGVSGGAVWWAVGWGALTALGASAQYQLAPGSWITALHVVTGLGAIGWGQHLVSRIHHATASDSPAVAGSDVAIKDAAAEFLAKKRVAVTGVSRKTAQHGSNIVYQRLRDRGYEVFAINPNATEVEGDRCFPDLKSVPGGVDAVVIGTRPERAMASRTCGCTARSVPAASPTRPLPGDGNVACASSPAAAR